MHNFGFVKSKQILNVSINDKTYPVVKAGKGIPCLFICLGTPSLRTISNKFAGMFEIYSSDVYWIENSALDNPDLVTMDTIIDDIKAMVDALNLKQFVIFGHSAYGIVALEFAKKYPNVASGIIMVGTPVNSNQEVGVKNNLIFQKTADEKRKLIDFERRAQVAKEDLSQLTLSERWMREYIYRDAPRYWHIPDFDCTELWRGVLPDKLLLKLFTDILPETEVLTGLEKIEEPIFLAAGTSDYDCCPWMWQEVPNLPKNFMVSVFNNSGHWPHYEEAKLFDMRIEQWLSESNII